MKKTILTLVLAASVAVTMNSCSSGAGQNTAVNQLHTVKKCDNLTTVARMYGLGSADSVAALNPDKFPKGLVPDGNRVFTDVKKVRKHCSDSTVVVDSTQQYVYAVIKIGEQLIVGKTTSIDLNQNLGQVTPAGPSFWDKVLDFIKSIGEGIAWLFSTLARALMTLGLGGIALVLALFAHFRISRTNSRVSELEQLQPNGQPIQQPAGA